ncbi:WD40 repeat protein [Thermocatellispora tengchongensis]|uniref:WD40 repeat protein n=1 Tax=Thermocatellispora tengchongensis TaxID=1073253 RepID=A0A840PMW1_9ACTN|nr:hypothetical protein [Thermocatellispora tengchongensis]MBB5138377.1 WD40 repeat protein [Thermocatellispora tengchongensis]
MLDRSGQELWRTADAPSTVTDLAWTRDGRRLAVCAYNGVYCHERHQAAPVAAYPDGGSHLAIAITPNGRWICTGNQDSSIRIWRARDAAEPTMSGYNATPDPRARRRPPVAGAGGASRPDHDGVADAASMTASCDRQLKPAEARSWRSD